LIPTELRANFNSTITVEDKASQVPTGYTPKFVIGGASSLSKAGTVVGDDLVFAFLAADTAAFATGQYWYQLIAEDTSSPVNRVFIADGTIFIDVKITGTGTYDGRSVAEKILEAIDQMMLGKATSDMQSYMIQSGSGSRSLSKVSPADLLILRKYYAGLVSQEKRTKNDGPLFKRHTFTFVKE
jgi:hypothetical protein